MSIERIAWHNEGVEKLFRASGASILVPPGIPIKPIIHGSLPVGDSVMGGLRPDELAWVSLRLEYSQRSERFEVASFGIDRRADEFEVSGAFLRTVKVQAIAKLALAEALPSWGVVILELLRNHSRAQARGLPPFKAGDEGILLLTAMVYRIAAISGENPAQAVAESLGLKTRTATNWIQRARNAGFMTTTDHAREARQAARRIEPYFRVGSDANAVAEELVPAAQGDEADGHD